MNDYQVEAVQFQVDPGDYRARHGPLDNLRRGQQQRQKRVDSVDFVGEPDFGEQIAIALRCSEWLLGAPGTVQRPSAFQWWGPPDIRRLGMPPVGRQNRNQFGEF